ncbi:hypothetical protein [Micromonospora sp. HM5-17]|uniref:hypothetical protein n=1 Tax=Micromonospora sp. HM5-17 TaxID=2487710 RepID=UPI00131599AB|nr:hypothetical protein [Micromonospora sp. HM5-17]
MICPECGQEAEAGAAYCLNAACGARLPGAGSTPSRETASSATSAPRDAIEDPGPGSPPTPAPPSNGGPTNDGPTNDGPGAAPPSSGGSEAAAPVAASGGGLVGSGRSAPRPGPTVPVSRLLPVGAVVLVLVLAGSIGLFTRDRAGPPEPVPVVVAPTGMPVELAPSGVPVDLPGVTATPAPARSPTPSANPAPTRRTPGTGAARTTPAGQPRPTSRRTTTAPARPAPTTPSRTSSGSPYLTASVSAFCRGGGSWAFTISGRLHGASAGYYPHGWVYHSNRSGGYGYPIDGDSSTHFSGTVPPDWGGEHTLTAPSARWELEVWLNRRMDGEGLLASGTVRNPC